MKQLCQIEEGKVVMLESNEYLLFIVTEHDSFFDKDIIDRVKLTPISAKESNGKWRPIIDVDRWFSPTEYARVIEI